MNLIEIEKTKTFQKSDLGNEEEIQLEEEI